MTHLLEMDWILDEWTAASLSLTLPWNGDNFHWECLKILECRAVKQQLVNSCFSQTRERKKILLDES